MEVIVPVPVRRLTLSLLLGGGLLAGGAAPATVAAQTTCDPSYPDFCIPAAWDVGTWTAPRWRGPWFAVIPPDPRGFDADDGYGCESN